MRLISCVTLTLLRWSGRVRPFLEQCGVGRLDDAGELADHFSVERGLQHAPLPYPKVAFTHHDAVAEQQGDALDRLTFSVVLPIFEQHVLRIFGRTDHIDAGAIGRGLIDIPVPVELFAHPHQKILSGVVLVDRSGRDSGGRLAFHIIAIPFASATFELFGMNSYINVTATGSQRWSRRHAKPVALRRGENVARALQPRV